MKRGQPLARKTPLKRTPIKRKVAAAAPRPRPRVSKGDFPFSAKNAIRRRSGGRCELPRCTRAAAHFHHRLMRSHGGMGTVDNGLHVCEHCHTYIHANPALAYERGWLIRSGVGSEHGAP